MRPGAQEVEDHSIDYIWPRGPYVVALRRAPGKLEASLDVVLVEDFLETLRW